MKAIITILYLLLLTIQSFCQDISEIHSQYKFRNITTDQGLSNNLVYRISEDKNGYIWIATRQGLNRLTSTEIIKYYHDSSDSLSLPSDRIFSLCCDTEGTLWIGSENGICRYNYDLDCFIKETDSILSNLKFIYDITEDDNKNIWFTSEDGLIKYSNKTKKFSIFNNKNTSLPATGVRKVMKYRDNKLWLSLYPIGIGEFNTITNEVKYFHNKTISGKDINSVRIEKLYSDSDHTIWIGTYDNSAYKYSSIDSTFKHIDIDTHSQYATRIRAFFEDKENNLFVGTRAGLYCYNKQKNNFYLYADSKHQFSTLLANSIYASYKDSKNGLWLGTIYGGASYTNLEEKAFISYNQKDNNDYFLNNSTIFGMGEDAQDNLYVSTEGGINILNKETSKFSYITSHPGEPNSLSYNDVKSIAVLPNGDFWAGTNEGGLNFYSKKENTFKVYKNIPNDSTSLPYNKIYTVFLDKDQNLWTLSNFELDNSPSVLSFLKKGSTKFIHYKHNCYFGITESKSGDLFIGAWNGFLQYNKKKNTFIQYTNDTIIGKKVWNLHLDRNNNLWIGSNRGIVRYNFITNTYTNYNDKLTHPASSAYEIFSDSDDNIWFSTNSGLVKLLGAINLHHDSVSVRIYNKEDGLPSNEFNYNSGFQNKKGELFFGGNRGFVRFTPHKISDSPYKPEIVISDLIIDGKSIKPGDFVQGKKILTTAINATKALSLSYKNRTFTLAFDALHFANPEKNGFKYMLENFDNDWITTNIYNNYVTYANLEPGTYTFKIFATHNSIAYNNEPKTLIIKIIPPIWKTWPFRIILLVIVTVLILMIYKARIRKFVEDQKRLTQAVEKRTEELHKSNLNLQKQKSETEARNAEIQLKNTTLESQQNEISEKNLLLEKANTNLKYLNDFGKELTSKLNISDIYVIIEQYIKSFAQIDIIGFGFYNKENQCIDFTNFIENGVQLPSFSSSLDDTTSIAAYSFKNNKPVIINNLKEEYKTYISGIKIKSKNTPQSVIYLPLSLRNKVIGILTIQSINQNAFSDETMQSLYSLLSYITISIDNAYAYNVVKHQKEELEIHRNDLELLVTERTKKLELAKNKAEESDRLKSAFLANMSHEIRTPLNAINGFIDFIDDPEIDKTQKRSFIELIKENSLSLSQLINDIIDLAILESKQLKLTQEKVNLDQLLTNCYNNFSDELKSNTNRQNISLELINQSEHNIIITTDGLRINQIINNLLSNAIKFTEKGKVEFGIKSYIPHKEVTIYVKDTGIGIDSQYLDSIFKRFYKIEKNIDILYRGIGLGLALTKNLVQLMGGKIIVDSQLNKGSEFTIIFPLTEELSTEKSETVIIKKSKGIPNCKNKVFLIAEDDESNLLLLESLLKKTHATLCIATDGYEAIELFKQKGNDIDLVLLDIKMPRANGYEVLKAIKEIDKNKIVIAQTAHAMQEDERKVKEAGFDDYIAKPIIAHKFYSLIAQYI